MDLNQLVVFVEVVATGSFTAAADALGISKSTVSRKVAALESRLGAQLLQRTTRELRLTDVGAAYYERVAEVVEEARTADEIVEELQNAPCGTLRVTAPMTFAFLGTIVAEYLRQNPDVRIEMHCTDRVVDLLGEGFDVAVRAGRLVDSTLIARRLGTVRRFLMAAPGYLQGRTVPHCPADLTAHHTVFFAGGQEASSWTLRCEDEEVDVRLEPRLRVNDYEMLREAVHAGMGITLMPDYLCRGASGRGLLRILPGWEAPEIPVHAIYYGGHISKKVAAFLDLVKQRFSASSDRGPSG